MVVRYLSLGAAAAAYAAYLNTDAGKRFAQEYTWLSVVLGTVLVMVSLLGELDEESWNKVAAAFLVAGVPIIGRSLLNRARRASE